MRPERPNGDVARRSRPQRRHRLGALTVALLTAATLGAGCTYPPEDADPTGSASGSPEATADASPDASPDGSAEGSTSASADAADDVDQSSGAPAQPVLPSEMPQDPWERTHIVEPSTGMNSERLIAWQDYRAVTAEGERPRQATELEFLLVSGNENCFGVRAEVEEDAQTVRVATIRGVLQDTLDACTAEGRMVSLVVELEQPLGDREVVPMEEENVGLAD
ncbi:hypothetical protein GCM10027060_00910 [Nesterenkonia halophila]|uniref:hypothetical protein n=1 Tax=Nesterenkonia halophila TaxID=302044 RepID=UPI0012926EE7|nr:hypothetical protein [Nesterenkonia halophila]